MTLAACPTYRKYTLLIARDWCSFLTRLETCPTWRFCVSTDVICFSAFHLQSASYQNSGTALFDIPGDVGQLCGLKEARFSNCRKMVKLPESGIDRKLVVT
ncbi:hypothetical protein M758_9G044300 [Ceratodon purpureus]|nr:hypothetical protein M758_9G044300 [Ceratodon purpureus]